jgi:hypothetical protein
MIPPLKPFPDYKWRWATLTPTEGLNEPPFFLGVLRVFRAHEGSAPSSAAISEGLSKVEREVAERVNSELRLVRSQKRNLIRNSGQYWKALGVLDSARTRAVNLTPLGRAVADGLVTKDDFAALTIKMLTLPNEAILSSAELAVWKMHSLEIKPLELLMQILRWMGERFGAEQSFLTPEELVKIVVPLAGDSRSTQKEYLESLASFRLGSLDLTGWPDCAPESNDRRMAREFLLFLANYGLLEMIPGMKNANTQFRLKDVARSELNSFLDRPVLLTATRLEIAQTARSSGASAVVERARITRSVSMIPRLAKFRRDVLKNYAETCLVTGERIRETLEAAHIIPVEYQGSDALGNGICLRSDIHSLFDADLIRFRPDGRLVVSGEVGASPNYRFLPTMVAFPTFLLPEAIAWRWNYQ